MEQKYLMTRNECVKAGLFLTNKQVERINDLYRNKALDLIETQSLIDATEMIKEHLLDKLILTKVEFAVVYFLITVVLVTFSALVFRFFQLL